MKHSSRHLFLAASVALFFTLTFALLAQEPPAPKSPPAADAPAAVAAPPADTPSVATPPAPAADAATPSPAETPAAEPAAPARKGGLRRIDTPTPDGTSEKSAEPRKSRKRSLNGHSKGGDVPFGDHVISAGSEVADAVSIFGSTTVEGTVHSDAVSVLGTTQVAAGGQVGGAAVAVLGPLNVEGDVKGEAVSVLGGVTINGKVGAEAVSVLGDMHLGPKAEVNGDLVIVGGQLTRDPGAIVHGNQVNVPLLGGLGGVGWLVTWITECALKGRLLAFAPHLGWAWGIAFCFLGFYLLLALVFGKAIEKCAVTFETRPGSSILASVLTVLLSPIAIVLLAITVIGALVVPFVAVGLFIAGLFGKAVMLAWIGRRITKPLGQSPLNHPFFAVLIGGLLVMLLYTVWGSFLLYKLLSWLGLGVVVYTLILANKREKAAAAVAAGSMAGVPPVSGIPVPGAPVTPDVVAPASAVSAGFAAPVATETMAAPPPVPFAATPPPVAATSPSAPEVPGPATMPMTSPGFGSASAAPSPGAPVAGIVPDLPVGGGLPPPATPPPMTPPPPVPPVRPAMAALPAVTASLPRAGFFLRLAALALDAVLIGILTSFVSGVLPRSLHFWHGPGGFLIVLAAYGALMWKHKGTTIGGIVCSLKVVRIDNRPIDWSTAVVRALGCFLSLAVAGLGFIWVAFDDDKQSWHDKIAGTTVVQVPKGMSLL
jgi:uncharacterized RDD family membrane protein YckC